MQACANVVQKGSSLEIKDILQWNEAAEELCNRHNVLVKNSQEKFLFTMESWGQLDPKQILTNAIKFEKLVSKL